jgi:hypothetical protein
LRVRARDLLPPGQSILRAGLPPGRLIVKPLAADASEASQPTRCRRPERLRRAVRTFTSGSAAALIEEFIGIREIHAAMSSSRRVDCWVDRD